MDAKRLLGGAAAGLVATGPMTAVMLSLHRRLPATQRYALPPRRITMRAARKAHVKHKLDDEPRRTAATYVAHFGYGAGMGALYGALLRNAPGHPMVKGTGFGLLVWAVSYLGLMPATGLHPPATREPKERNGLMILAHLVWGAALGVLAEAVDEAT